MHPGKTGSMQSKFWKNRKVFLTGHTGFKGGWMSLWLQSLGAELTGYSLEPVTKNNLFTITEIGKNMNSIIGDIRDLESITKHMKECAPEIVIHMAAQPLVRDSYVNPIKTYSTNLMGTINLFEAARETENVKVVINITSDKCYENYETTHSFKETDPMGGFDPYSNSKGCSELITSSYRNSFFKDGGFDNSKEIAIASVRAGNVIGGGDWSKDRLVPDILNSFEKNKAVTIRNPNAIRPWQHVLEPIGGYLSLAEKLYTKGNQFSEGWNFGPKHDGVKTVEWIVQYMRKSWGNQPEYIHDIGDNPHEAKLLMLDISKAEKKLGWTPKLSIEEAIDNVISWHKEFLNSSDMRSISLEQIKNYINKE